MYVFQFENGTSCFVYSYLRICKMVSFFEIGKTAHVVYSYLRIGKMAYLVCVFLPYDMQNGSSCFVYSN